MTAVHRWGWRAMQPGDLASVSDIARAVHPDFPEDDAVFAERLRLYPAGCRMLASDDGERAGYVVSHPWGVGSAPKLNALIGAIPKGVETCYYIHDIAVLPQMRASGAGPQIVAQLAVQAVEQGCRIMALVAVNRSVQFWQRNGFHLARDPAIQASLASYGEDARYMTRKLTT